MSEDDERPDAVVDRDGDVWRNTGDYHRRDRDGMIRRYSYVADTDELGNGPVTLIPGGSAGGAQPQLDRLAAYCTSWEVNHDGWARVWDDPDGGELRIVAALRRILAETDHHDVQVIVAQEFDRPGANDNVTGPEVTW